MTSDLERKLLAGAAYRIFFEETKKHLAGTALFFESNAWGAEQIQEAAGRFHTIRGGAGFFQLKSLASVAGELEVSLQHSSPEQVVHNIEKLKSLYQQLADEVAAIPNPSQG